MQLYYFLAILFSLSLGALPETNQSFLTAVGFTSLVIIAWWVLCYQASRLVGRLIEAGEVSPSVGYDWFDRQTECLRWFSIGLIFLCLGGFGLGRQMNQIPWLCDSLSLQSMVLLFPALAMMIGLWAAEYQFSVRLKGNRFRWKSAWAVILMMLRSSVGWLIAPILGCMLVVDALSLASIREQVPPWVGWVALIAMFVVGIPALVRRVFPTKTMDQPTLQWIQQIIAATSIGRCKIILWDTGNRAHNAMIAGLFGRFRVLMLSDRLVRDLSRPQLAMVILHEVAHAKRHHVPLRIASLVPAWLLGATLEHSLRSAKIHGWAADGVGDWAGVIGNAVSVLSTILILRWVSYRSEYDADQQACAMAPTVSLRCADVPATETEGRQQLAAALWCVTADHESCRKPTWLHPGLHDRINAFS